MLPVLNASFEIIIYLAISTRCIRLYELKNVRFSSREFRVIPLKGYVQ